MSFPSQEHIEAAQYAADFWKRARGVYVWPSVTLAQADVESAGWTRLSGANNGFGITATPEQIARGEATDVWTREFRGGVYVRMKRAFANYPSLRDAYLAHAELLATSGYYEKARHDRNARQFVIDIAEHYASAPNYAQVILGRMDALGLARYDAPDHRTASDAPPLKPPAGPMRRAQASASAAAAAACAGVAGFFHHGGAALVAGALVALVAGAVAVYRLRRAQGGLPPAAPPVAATIPPAAPPSQPAAAAAAPAPSAVLVQHPGA